MKFNRFEILAFLIMGIGLLIMLASLFGLVVSILIGIDISETSSVIFVIGFCVFMVGAGCIFFRIGYILADIWMREKKINKEERENWRGSNEK